MKQIIPASVTQPTACQQVAVSLLLLCFCAKTWSPLILMVSPCRNGIQLRTLWLEWVKMLAMSHKFPRAESEDSFKWNHAGLYVPKSRMLAAGQCESCECTIRTAPSLHLACQVIDINTGHSTAKAQDNS